MWQNLIVGGAGVLALTYLARRYWPGRRQAQSGCGSCGGCAQSCGRR